MADDVWQVKVDEEFRELRAMCRNSPPDNRMATLFLAVDAAMMGNLLPSVWAEARRLSELAADHLR